MVTEEIFHSCSALSIDLSVNGNPVIVLQTRRYDLYTAPNVLGSHPVCRVYGGKPLILLNTKKILQTFSILMLLVQTKDNPPLSIFGPWGQLTRHGYDSFFYSIQLQFQKVLLRLNSCLTMTLQELMQISSRPKMDFWNLIQIVSRLKQLPEHFDSNQL